MRQFSGRGALGAGFGLIAREPLAFLAWSVVYLVVGVLPLFAIAAPMFGDFMRLAAERSEPDAARLMALQSRMIVLQPISLLSSLAASTLLLGAIFRAVLTPDDRRFLYLRGSAAELWLGLILIVLGVMLMLALFALMIPVFIIVGVTVATAGAGAEPDATTALIVPAAIFAILGVLFWGWLRVSLALPMSFAERTFRLHESWSLTRGQAGKMFLVYLCLILIVFAAEMALFLVVILVFAVAAASGGLGDLATGEAADPFAFFKSINPAVWMVAGVLYVLLTTALKVVFTAPLARIYADLREETAEA